MKCTFYRTKEINLNEWRAIRNKLHDDLEELEKGEVTEKEARNYLEALLMQAEMLEKNNAMCFFGFDKPEHMPSDIRVEYFYWPTYLAAAITMKSCLMFPGILNRINLPKGQNAIDTFHAVLLGCTGREFRGSGCDDVKGLVEVTEFFVFHNALDFLELNEELCCEFSECLNKALLYLLSGVKQGKVAGAWGDDYTDRSFNILVRAGMLPLEKTESRGTRFYLAYGSNTNTQQMCIRCPGAKIAGISKLSDWRLVFKGNGRSSYLTIEPAKGYHVPVVVWTVTVEDEVNLDCYEGFPDFYYKKEFEIELTEESTGTVKDVTAFIYIMNEEYNLGRPTENYMKCCQEGYEYFGFDPAVLAQAYVYSCGN